MKGISHISAALREVTKCCMNCVWCKRWPNCIPALQDHVIALASIADTVTEIAKEIGLDDVQVGGINELLESRGKVIQHKIKY
jgi:uncharacterized Fe-S cluster-containing radical SAM superfamily protein